MCHTAPSNQVNLIVAVDFTASNGDCHMRDSLHYVDPTGQTSNHYVSTIQVVGQVIEAYDRDKVGTSSKRYDGEIYMM